MKLHRKIRHSRERGIALMVALLALALLAAIGMGFMFMADTENSINNNYRDAQKAYFAARAGAENVRALLAPGDPITGLGKGPLFNQASAMTMPLFSTPSGVIYVTNPNAVDPKTIVPTASAGTTPSGDPYMDDEICQEQFVDFVNNGLTATTGPCWSGTSPQLISSGNYYALPTTTLSTTDMPGTGGANALAFKWVRISNKQNFVGLLKQTLNGSTNKGLQVCFDGFREVAITSGTCASQFPQAMTPVWVLTSLAVTPGFGPNPGSRRMVQMETALIPPITAPAPIAASAPITLTGSSMTAVAYDACNCTAAGTPLPGSTVTSCTSPVDAVYSASTITSDGQPTLVSGSGATGTAALAASQPWPYDIDKMIQSYSASATPATGPPWNLSCNNTPDCGKLQGPTTVPFGTYPTGGLPGNATGQVPMQVYIPGSVEFRSDVSGAGLLIVNGDLTVDGNFSFYGLVLVKGHLKFEGGGGGAQNVNIYGAVLAGQDFADDADKIGGNFHFYYDTCALKQNQSKAPPRMLAMHEVMY